jgi:hypothetical protein
MEITKALSAQLPKTESLAGSVVWIGDLEAGSQEISEQVNASIERSAQTLRADDKAGEIYDKRHHRTHH